MDYSTIKFSSRRQWYSRNDAVTCANSVSACGDWFIPTISQLQNPGFVCRSMGTHITIIPAVEVFIGLISVSVALIKFSSVELTLDHLVVNWEILKVLILPAQ